MLCMCLSNPFKSSNIAFVFAIMHFYKDVLFRQGTHSQLNTVDWLNECKTYWTSCMNVSLRMTVTAFFGSISQHALCLQIPLSHPERGGWEKRRTQTISNLRTRGTKRPLTKLTWNWPQIRVKKFTSIVIVYKFLHKKVRLLISYNSSSSRLPCLWRKNLTYFTFPDFRVSDIIWILTWNLIDQWPKEVAVNWHVVM